VCFQEATRHGQSEMYIRFDLRFLAKIGIGIAYTIFGEKILETKYMKELKKALWFREGGEMPLVKGASFFSEGNKQLKQPLGEKHSVTISIIPVAGEVFVSLNIGMELNFLVKCASFDELSQTDLMKLGKGVCIVIFKPLKKSVCLNFPDFLAHKYRVIPHPELMTIANNADKHKDYLSGPG